jgi:hypothetical protein
MFDDLILGSRALWRGVSKDAGPSVASWFETALKKRLLTMRDSQFS